MQFVFQTAEALDLLTGLFKFKLKNPAVVELENFCFELTADKNLTVKIYDLDTMVKVQLPAKLEADFSPFSFMINAQEVIDFLKSFSSTTNPEFSLDVDLCTGQCTFSIPNFEQQLCCLSGENFPKISGLPSTVTSFSIPNVLMYKIINRSLEIVSQDDMRPTLCGIYFKVNDNLTIDTCATDANKLFTCNYPATVYVKSDVKSFILNGNAAKKIKHLLPKKIKNTSDIQECKIRFDGDRALMTIGKYSLITRVVYGNYPQFECVIPTEEMFTQQVQINRSVLLSGIKLVEKSANKTNNAVKFTFNDKMLELYARDEDFKKSAKTIVGVQHSTVEEGTFEIAFNCEFLKTLLFLFDEDNLVFLLCSSNKPAIIQQQGVPNETALLMPIMLKHV